MSGSSAILFEALLASKDILDCIVFDWLETKDLILFDSAILGAPRRAQFHHALAAVRYRVPFEKSLESWWRNNKQILNWFINRKMYNSEGIWHVNQKLWELMMTDGSYNHLVAGMRGIRFENFCSETALSGLDKCASLYRLEICNLLVSASEGAPLHIPSLRELYLQNVEMSADFLRLFSKVPSLKKIQLHHVRYHDCPADVAAAFIGNTETITVVGGLDGFLAHIIQTPTNLQNVTIDKMHKAELNPLDLSTFLERSPQLRNLSVERMRLNIPSFFRCLATYNRHLRFLHLNHIRAVEEPTSCPVNTSIDLTFNRLQISTLLPSTNQAVLSIIMLCKDTVSELGLSFCSKMDNGGYVEIAKVMRLYRMEIDDRADLFEGVEQASRVNDLAQIFSNVSNFRLTVWPEWKSEKEKLMVPEQKNIVVDWVFAK